MWFELFLVWSVQLLWCTSSSQVNRTLFPPIRAIICLSVVPVNFAGEVWRLPKVLTYCNYDIIIIICYRWKISFYNLNIYLLFCKIFIWYSEFLCVIVDTNCMNSTCTIVDAVPLRFANEVPLKSWLPTFKSYNQYFFPVSIQKIIQFNQKDKYKISFKHKIIEDDINKYLPTSLHLSFCSLHKVTWTVLPSVFSSIRDVFCSSGHI